MKKFRARPFRGWGAAIEAVECERETDKCVFVREGRRLTRESKGRTDYRLGIFDTYEEARSAVIAEAEMSVRQSQSTLDIERDRLSKAKSLPKKEPA